MWSSHVWIHLIWSSYPSIFSEYVNFTCLNTPTWSSYPISVFRKFVNFTCLNILHLTHPLYPTSASPWTSHILIHPIWSSYSICLREIREVHMFEYPLIWSSCPSSSSVFSQYVNFTCLNAPHLNYLIILSFLFILLQQVRELHMFEYPHLIILSYLRLHQVCELHMFESPPPDYPIRSFHPPSASMWTWSIVWKPLIWSFYPFSLSVFRSYVFLLHNCLKISFLIIPSLSISRWYIREAMTTKTMRTGTMVAITVTHKIEQTQQGLEREKTMGYHRSSWPRPSGASFNSTSTITMARLVCIMAISAFGKAYFSTYVMKRSTTWTAFIRKFWSTRYALCQWVQYMACQWANNFDIYIDTYNKPSLFLDLMSSISAQMWLQRTSCRRQPQWVFSFACCMEKTI